MKHIQSYVWYDPWEMMEEATWRLERAEDIEYNVGHSLNAMARAHERDTYCTKTQLEQQTLAFLNATQYLNPYMIKK